MRKSLIAVAILVLALVAFSYDYEVTVEASGSSYSEARDKALNSALSSLSKMIYVKVSEEVQQSVELSTEKGRKETYKKQLNLKTKLILEGYRVEILKEWKKNKDFWVMLKVTIPLDRVKVILKDAVTLEKAYNLYENGFLTEAMKVLKENEEFLDEIAGYSIEKDKLVVNINEKMEKLKKLYERALKSYKNGQVRSILYVYSKMEKDWKDFPKMDEIEGIVSEVVQDIEVKTAIKPEELLVGGTTRLRVDVLYKNRYLDDGSEILVKTPDGEYQAVAEGTEVYFDISPSFVAARYNIDVYISGIKLKSQTFPVRVIPGYRSLKQCYFESSKKNYSMLKVNEKVNIKLRTLPGVWLYLFDYKESTQTLKTVLVMRVTGDGELAFPISFDSPTEKFYEGLIVVFSKDKINEISDGVVYTVEEVRSILEKKTGICEKEALFIITK